MAHTRLNWLTLSSSFMLLLTALSTAEPALDEAMAAKFDAQNALTRQIMLQVERTPASSDLQQVIVNSYPYHSPRNVLALPMQRAIPITDLPKLCVMDPKEIVLIAACDRDHPDANILVLSDCALYIVPGKAYAAYLKHPALYKRFAKGNPQSLAIPYAQLNGQKLLTVNDGRAAKISKDTGIPACIDAITAFLASPRKTAAPKIQFFKGHTLIVPPLDLKAAAMLRDSMQKLAATNADSVCLAVNASMKTFNEPHILWGQDNNLPDSTVLQAIQIARDSNLKVILKPMVNPDDSIWRAWIEFTDPRGKPDLAAWQQWWTEYDAFILHYAQLASQTQCEMLCIGCEMNSTERFEHKWRSLIADCRKVYGGLLTYNCNHGNEDSVRFWDALDLIGASGYYNLGQYMQAVGIAEAASPDYVLKEADLKAAWRPIREKLKALSETWNKPVFFIECGVTSSKNVARTPWEHPSFERPYDGMEQAVFYKAAIESLWDEPWFIGFAWWDWPASLYPKQEAHLHPNFAIYGKPAEDIVKAWYAKERVYFQPQQPVEKGTTK